MTEWVKSIGETNKTPCVGVKEKPIFIFIKCPCLEFSAQQITSILLLFLFWFVCILCLSFIYGQAWEICSRHYFSLVLLFKAHEKKPNYWCADIVKCLKYPTAYDGFAWNSRVATSTRWYLNKQQLIYYAVAKNKTEKKWCWIRVEWIVFGILCYLLRSEQAKHMKCPE